MGSDTRQSSLMDEDIIGVDFVRQRSAYLMIYVFKGNGNDCLFLGIRKQERVFKPLSHAGGFFFSHPFLKKAGKGGAVNNFPRRLVFHGYFTVSSQGNFGQMVSTACPVGKTGEFVQINIQMLGISRKDVIHPKSLVFKEIIKILCESSDAHNAA